MFFDKLSYLVYQPVVHNKTSMAINKMEIDDLIFHDKWNEDDNEIFMKASYPKHNVIWISYISNHLEFQIYL